MRQGEQIAQQLREEILKGHFQPGERLPPERRLAEDWGVNRASVREGLKSLEQQGLLEIRQGGGATVQHLECANLQVIPALLFRDGHVDRSVATQIFEVQEMLLVGATRLAIEHGDSNELARAEILLTQLAKPSTSDDQYLDTIEALLSLIAEASHNLVLRLASNAIRPIFEASLREHVNACGRLPNYCAQRSSGCAKPSRNVMRMKPNLRFGHSCRKTESVYSTHSITYRTISTNIRADHKEGNRTMSQKLSNRHPVQNEGVKAALEAIYNWNYDAEVDELRTPLCQRTGSPMDRLTRLKLGARDRS